MNAAEVVAAIAVPLLICFIGLAVAGVRGIIRFAQYLARAEAAQDRMADSNEDISMRLTQYMTRTDGALATVDKRLTRVEYKLGES